MKMESTTELEEESGEYSKHVTDILKLGLTLVSQITLIAKMAIMVP